MPLLAAVVTAAAIFVGAAIAGGSPPPQPPFDYPSPGEDIGRFPAKVGECGKAGKSLPLYTPRRANELPAVSLAYGTWAGQSLKRPRIFLARRPEQVRRWLYLTDSPGYVRKQLTAVDFRKCTLLAIFVPGNVDVAVLGIRLNNPTTLTIGLYRSPHITGQVCGSTGGVTTPVVPCTYSPPVDGSEVFFALSEKTVRDVDHVYGITHGPPPPPPPNSTTG
jgi:hypothetical protein